MRNNLLIFRKLLIVVIAIWIFNSMGIAGFVDYAYFIIVFTASILLALIIRKFRLRGLAYVIEYTAMITGFISALCNTVYIYRQDVSGMIPRLPLCILPLFYGLCLSTLNGMMIQKRRSGV